VAANQHLGIGLALAKRAADRISATLELGNRKAGGARVRVAFPVPKEAAHV
jgi:nitrogen fixation/metabolism regulation signal transduction histidine kinase